MSVINNLGGGDTTKNLKYVSAVEPCQIRVGSGSGIV